MGFSMLMRIYISLQDLSLNQALEGDGLSKDLCSASVIYPSCSFGSLWSRGNPWITIVPLWLRPMLLWTQPSPPSISWGTAGRRAVPTDGAAEMIYRHHHKRWAPRGAAGCLLEASIKAVLLNPHRSYFLGSLLPLRPESHWSLVNLEEPTATPAIGVNPFACAVGRITSLFRQKPWVNRMDFYLVPAAKAAVRAPKSVVSGCWWRARLLTEHVYTCGSSDYRERWGIFKLTTLAEESFPAAWSLLIAV